MSQWAAWAQETLTEAEGPSELRGEEGTGQAPGGAGEGKGRRAPRGRVAPALLTL